MTRQQLVATVVACGGKAPRVRRIRSDCGSGRLVLATRSWSWFRGVPAGGAPHAWTPQDCSDSDADLFEGGILTEATQ